MGKNGTCPLAMVEDLAAWAEGSHRTVSPMVANAVVNSGLRADERARMTASTYTARRTHRGT